MKYIFCLLLLPSLIAFSQKLKKADKQILANLENHISYLSNDQLEGRRTGTNGEKLAYEYIVKEFEKAGLVAKGEKETYLQEFQVNDGIEVDPASQLIIDGNDLKLNEEYFPFSCSPNTSLEATASIALQETSNPWFYDIRELIDAGKNNPHFDLDESIKTKAAAAAKKGANAFIIFNSSGVNDDLKFEPKDRSATLAIPVLYIVRAAKEKYMKDETATLDIKLKIALQQKIRYGHNVIGFINNNAANTIIIGAHYDHLGYGEDHNSLFTGTTPEIHNGADDNASGTGALIELGKLLKNGDLKNNNYLEVAFSGEELGLFGSKYFTEHPTVGLGSINYMINLDMIGRLKEDTHALNIGGYGTSPGWADILLKAPKYFKLNLDSSGTGPSDHTSFYRKDIPVLFFFTGTHSDYHKPTDDADKVNYLGELQVIKFIYKLIEKADNKGKLAFLKTREMQSNMAASFKVTLGIMPDYTYTGNGVRADGVIDGRTAQKAGIKPGDVITQLGDYKFADLQTYMETLNKFNKGDATRVKVTRGNDEIMFDIVF